MDFELSSELLVKTLHELREINKKIPILVEGRKDVLSLKKIGFTGTIITLHSGKDIPTLCDDLAAKWTKIILLTDWDRKGWKLSKRIEECLRGRITCLTRFRLILAEHAPFKDIESVATFFKNTNVSI